MIQDCMYGSLETSAICRIESYVQKCFGKIFVANFGMLQNGNGWGSEMQFIQCEIVIMANY